MRKRSLFLLLYLAFAILPIYWLAITSLKTSTEMASGLTFWPRELTWDNYRVVLTDPAWYGGYLSALIYATVSTVLALAVALPAAYAFSRYRFVGSRPVLFWLLLNRVVPPAVFLPPLLHWYGALGLMDTHLAVALAHLVFNLPIAVWILEGFMSRVPREIDEAALLDGHAFPQFFRQIFLPLIRTGIGVTAVFCFMSSWVELLLARALTAGKAAPIAATLADAAVAGGADWGVLAAAAVLAIVPGALLAGLVRHYLAKGFSLGRI